MKKKFPIRDYTMGVRLKPYEHQYLQREADERGKLLSEYVRDVLLATMSERRFAADKITLDRRKAF